MRETKKITILGAGNVGASIAYSIIQKGLTDDLVLIDIAKDKAEGEALDLSDAARFCNTVNITSGDYPDAVDSDIVILTLGANRKPGQSRLDLVDGNVRILESVLPQLEEYAKNAVFIVVSNPVDMMTYAFIKKALKVPKKRIIGTGTLLDTSRLCSRISKDLDIDPNMVNVFVLGEHGDTSFVPWSFAKIAGMPIEDFYKRAKIELDKEALIEDVRKGGAQVISKKGATFYAIALSVAELCDAILNDKKTIYPLSTLVNVQDVGQICLSVPCKVGREGILESIKPKKLKLATAEKEKMRISAKALREVIENTEAFKE